MLEWMHDSFVVEKLRGDFATKTMEDCATFIANSISEKNIHLAIADDHDEYMGTVSLKNIIENTAEFAIVVHRDAMGKEYSIWAMREIFRKGFEEYNIESIYWCVDPNNARALRFYDKNDFQRVKSDDIKIENAYTIEQIERYIWYQVKRN